MGKHTLYPKALNERMINITSLCFPTSLKNVMDWVFWKKKKIDSDCITCEIVMAIDSVTEMEKLELKLIYPSIYSLEMI